MRIKLTPGMASVLQACPFAFQQKYLFETVRQPAFGCNPASRLDQNIHAVLGVFYKRGGHANLSEADLMDFLNRKWNIDGFRSIEEELEYKQEASRLLRNYYTTSIHEGSCQLRTSQIFHVTANPVILGRHKVILSGRFDRLDLFEDGSLEVVIFQTGRLAGGLPDRHEFALLLSNLVYFRLAQDLFPEASMITVSNYYLRSVRKISVQYTPEIIQSARTELEILLDGLEEGIAPTLVNHNCSACLVRRMDRCRQFDQSEESLVTPVLF